MLSEIAKTIQLSWPPHVYPYRLHFNVQAVTHPDSKFYNSKFSIKYFPQFLLRISPHD